MKGLTLTQPWASLVAYGLKVIETRSWRTSYRGPLLLHAATGGYKLKSLSFLWLYTMRDGRELSEEQRDAIAGHAAATRGQVVAVATLADCVPTHVLREKLQDRRWREADRTHPQRDELIFGNYDDGRWAWILRNVRSLENPVPVRGALGLWTPAAEVDHAIGKARRHRRVEAAEDLADFIARNLLGRRRL